MKYLVFVKNIRGRKNELVGKINESIKLPDFSNELNNLSKEYIKKINKFKTIS